MLEGVITRYPGRKDEERFSEEELLGHGDVRLATPPHCRPVVCLVKTQDTRQHNTDAHLLVVC